MPPCPGRRHDVRPRRFINRTGRLADGPPAPDPSPPRTDGLGLLSNTNGTDGIVNGPQAAPRVTIFFTPAPKVHARAAGTAIRRRAHEHVGARQGRRANASKHNTPTSAHVKPTARRPRGARRRRRRVAAATGRDARSRGGRRGRLGGAPKKNADGPPRAVPPRRPAAERDSFVVATCFKRTPTLRKRAETALARPKTEKTPAGRSARSWFARSASCDACRGLPEETEIVAAALANGFAVAALSARDDRSRRWSPEDGGRATHALVALAASRGWRGLPLYYSAGADVFSSTSRRPSSRAPRGGPPTVAGTAWAWAAAAASLPPSSPTRCRRRCRSAASTCSSWPTRSD